MELVKTVHGDAPITPGVLDHAALRAYTRGQCAALARALHNATGWPFVFAVWTNHVGDEAVHIYVQRPDGLVVDVTGPHHIDVALKRLERMGGTDIELGRGGIDVLNHFINHGVVDHGDTDIAEIFVDVVLTLVSP